MKQRRQRIKVFILLRIMWALAWLQRHIHAALGTEYILRSGYRPQRSARAIANRAYHPIRLARRRNVSPVELDFANEDDLQ